MLAKLIVELFPNEDESTWFQVASTQNYHSYKGKLYSSYRNFRKKYQSVGVVYNDEEENEGALQDFRGVKVDECFALIKGMELSSAEDLKTLIWIENRYLMMKFEKDGKLDNQSRDNIANIIISNIFKINPREK